MRTTTEPVTVNEKVGECPACKTGVWAEVTLTATVEEPRITNGKPTVYAHATAVAARIAHECSEAAS